MNLPALLMSAAFLLAVMWLYFHSPLARGSKG